jgi:hypothetical protein
MFLSRRWVLRIWFSSGVATWVVESFVAICGTLSITCKRDDSCELTTRLDFLLDIDIAFA